jgi:hypothetical protein
MSEAKLPEDKGVTIPDNSDPAVERALSNGWMEQVDWEAAGKDGADWVEAREFNYRGELMGKIQGMGRKLGNLENELEKANKGLAASAEVTRRMVEKQYDKAMADLKLQRREAYEVGDFEALDNIEERRDELREKRTEMDAPTPASAPAPAATLPVDISKMHPIERAFMDIMKTTPALQGKPDEARKVGEFADSIWSANPDISVVEFVNRVGEHMSPSREPAPQSPDGARSTARRPRAGSKFSINDLDVMERDMAETFVATGAYENVQEYIDVMAKAGDLSAQKR